MRIGICGFPLEGAGSPTWLGKLTATSKQNEIWLAPRKDEVNFRFAQNELRGTKVVIARPDWAERARLKFGKRVRVVTSYNPQAEIQELLA